MSPAPAIQITLTGQIDGNSVKMLLDTGSVVTLIDSEKVKELNINMHKLDKSVLTAAGGSPLATPGVIKSVIKLGNVEKTMTCIVCENLNIDMVLGADALDCFSAIIDLPNESLVVNKVAVPLKIDRQDAPLRL